MKPTSKHWSVECKPAGRDGYLFYREGLHEIPFYWEFGGGDTVVVVRVDDPSKFNLKYPWAVERKREIFERLATELIRQQAPSCRAEIDDRSICICQPKHAV